MEQEEKKITNNLRVGIIFSAFCTFLFLFSFSLVSAEKPFYNYQNSGDRVDFGGNYSINVNNTDYWQGYTPSTYEDWLNAIKNNTEAGYIYQGHFQADDGAGGGTGQEWYVEEHDNDVHFHFDELGGNNYVGWSTTGAFMELYANPNPSNNYKMWTVTETQGADTEINIYEGGTGHNRFWSSGSVRIGGGADYLCSNLTSDVDCNTPLTGADLVVQDDVWSGGKVYAQDWSNVSITESQISDLGNYVPYTGATSNVNLGAYDLTATDITATNIIFGGQTLSTLSTGTADNTKLVTQGYVDDNDFWEEQTATRITLKSPYTNIRGTFDLELIGQVAATTGDFTNLRASTFEPSSLTTSDLTIDNGGTLEIKEAVAWTSISDLWIKWDNEEIRFGAGTNGDVRQYFSGSDFYIDSRDITANDELRFTDFDEYNFDNDVVVDGKLYFENSSNGYIEWIGGTNESIGFYNSTGGFTTIEVDGVYVHSFITNLTDEEAYNLVENADDNNKSSWGECYHQKPVPDLTRPEYEYYNVELCEIELVEDCVTKNESVWIFDGEFYQRGINETTTCELVPNYEIEIVESYQPFVNSEGYFVGYEKINIEEKVPLPPVCINETRNKTIYPHEILSESLDLECKQVMNKKADKYRVNTKIILANEIHTNTTRDLDTMTKIENFRNVLDTKTFQQVKDYVLDDEGKLSNNILMDTELSQYGSYDLGAISHFNRAMVVFLMKENLNQAEEIQELKDKQQAQDDCWDLPLNEVQNCMRAI